MAKETKKVPGKSMAKYDEELARRAGKFKAIESSVATGSFISVRGGVLTYQDNAVPGNKIRVVVLAAIMENVFYQGSYDPNNPSPPACYAFGSDESEMAPHEKASDPQADACSECPMNEWGSVGDGSRGKACKNIRRLAVMVESALDGDISGAEVAFLKLPVTSVKAWASYVNQLSAGGLPPCAVITEIMVTPDAKTQFKVSFSCADRIEDDLLPEVFAKSDAAETEIAFPYQEASEVPFDVQPARSRQARGAKPLQQAPIRRGPTPPAAGRSRPTPPPSPPAAPARRQAAEPARGRPAVNTRNAAASTKAPAAAAKPNARTPASAAAAAVAKRKFST